MLGRIIAASARNRFLVLLGTAFLVVAGVWALAHTALDALPDLSDTQVIVYTEMPGQAPQVVEDQVTYPLTTALLGVPKSKVVRGFSFFGASFVYIIFEDGTDIYWARSRVLEYLNFASGRLPAWARAWKCLRMLAPLSTWCFVCTLRSSIMVVRRLPRLTAHRRSGRTAEPCSRRPSSRPARRGRR